MTSRPLEHQVDSHRQSYYLNQRNLIIHSNDRNEKIWPNANHFEVTIPNAYKNVQSIRLSNIILPRFSEPCFSMNNKNTKFDLSWNDSTNGTKIISVQIDDGDYTSEQMVNIIKNKISTSNNAIAGNGSLFNIDICYNDITRKMLFKSSSHEFDLLFNEKPTYVSTSCNQQTRIDTYDKLTNWGLGSFLGFEKKKYSSKTNEQIIWYYENYTTNQGVVNTNEHYIESDFELRLEHTENEVFYVELDHLNQFDEVTPDKLMDIVFTTNEVDQHTTSFFSEVVQLQGKGPSNSGSGVSHFNPPLDYINKLKFKFRHHDYSLVDFKNRDVTIVLQITTLEPDPFKVGRIRKPDFYDK